MPTGNSDLPNKQFEIQQNKLIQREEHKIYDRGPSLGSSKESQSRDKGNDATPTVIFIIP